MDTRRAATLRREQGHFTASETATRLGVNRFTFHYWQQRGLVPKPLITFTGRRRYYSEKDVDTIREIMRGENGDN